MSRKSVCLAAIAAGVAVVGPVDLATAQIKPHPGMLRYPDVSATHIVFGYANDLWLVSRDGGLAAPLASPPGAEMFPKFSDDGLRIAFLGNYDGNQDLYVIPRGGGVPHRVTHHPSTEVLCGWTPDDELIYYMRGYGGLGRTTQLFTVPAAGGLPAHLPVPYGANGAISPDGEWLAYTPHSRDHRTWKRYRGGMATDIWLFNLIDHSARQVTTFDGTDTQPMWHNDNLYFLSDAGPAHRLNIWKYDVGTDRREQVTFFDSDDVKWPSMGPGPDGHGEIIFQHGPELHLLDLATRKTTSIDVTIPGDRPSIRPKRVDASDHTRWWQISPTGKRAVVDARGDVWTLPAENGSPRNLTRTSGFAEREPSWSPDGRWVAYFSDETGEYELYITQSDGKGETKQLTHDSETFFFDPIWSPDSKHIVYRDKASQTYLHTIESGVTKIVDKDPWGYGSRPSWSHDSRWLAYARSSEDKPITAIWLYDLDSGERHQVTAGNFGDSSPTFDRKGNWLYFASSRSFSPTYSDVDTTFIYNQSEVLLATPLRNDVEAPWLPESDEETWEEEKEEDDEASEEDAEGDAEDTDGDAEPADDDAEESDDEQDGEDADTDDEPVDDGVSGTYEGTLSSTAAEFPPGMEFTATLYLEADGTLTGTIVVPMGAGEVEGSYDKDSGEFKGTITTDEGDVAELVMTIKGGSLTGTATLDGQAIDLNGTRTALADADDEESEDGKDDEAAEVVEIDIEGFERRAIQLPVTAGSFGDLSVNHKGHLLYVRYKPHGTPELMVFDIEDDKKQEKSVAKGASAYELSADGKKVLVIRGSGSAQIQNASAGASGKNVVTKGMIMMIEPREEWAQILAEAWRLQRDYLYVDNMHGVDWAAVRSHYEGMLDDCVTRSDLSYIIREMISELNIGHAYYRGGGSDEQTPRVSVGMLGIDWELADGAYRIKSLAEGAQWDVDARNPLRAPGIDVTEGQYVLAVNGVPMDTTRDPWASFQGLANRPITLTVSDTPVLDENTRDVIVEPMGGEGTLRYREWIESKRAYVEAQTDGQVGYVYVPDTGVNGQNNLVRQYFGQIDKKAIIIDERWNGGGQIPSRFIEMLNRPVTNYWARRDNKDWAWPPDAHQGPKCMLVNGLAGSGGDLFPWYFRDAGLGPLIGTRTWGGLVGISGNPSFIDGSHMTVPTFGFYERDGTWGVEGHGVDPDVVVIDDPSLMVNGGDPQLDKAIEMMLAAIEENPYIPPVRPSPPDRSGMGIPTAER